MNLLNGGKIMRIEMVKLFECGYCTHPEKIVNPKRPFKKIKFPATVALLKHPTKGYILFDTGYSKSFLDATRSFPYSIYAKLTPVFYSETQSIKNQLKNEGIHPSEIRYIILSHFHGDHTAGLDDFPSAEILTFKKAYDHIKQFNKIKALTKGCLVDLLPEDLPNRMNFIDEQPEILLSSEFHPFHEGFDVFGDGSLFAVDLTGHAIGQFGIFILLKSGKQLLLCADAVWTSQAYEELVFPHKIANLLIEDRAAYRENIEKLHQLSKNSPGIDILPTHCQKTWNLVKEGYIYE